MEPSPAPLRIGRHEIWPPVVLAPMAGVTNAPFRTLCRRFGPGLLYVSEMVMVAALVNGNAKTERMVTFGPDESPRSLQLYASDPHYTAEAVRRLAGADRVDHIDMNFGCPAQKVTRKGGGAAVPLKRNLYRAIVRAAVQAAAPHGIPVTVKFRKGIDDSLLTFLDAGRIARDEGVAAVALHGRTARQHYAGSADWGAIAELKAAVPDVPVLGNGDIWEAHDALRMMDETGCDGVVVGRGCLGRPWLFGDLVAAFSGKSVPAPPRLGEVGVLMVEHATRLSEHLGVERGARDFRKHAAWYLTGYPIGGEMRKRFSSVATISELEDLVALLDPAVEPPRDVGRIVRGHANGPINVVLPHGYLDHLDDETPPDDADVSALSGG